MRKLILLFLFIPQLCFAATAWDFTKANHENINIADNSNVQMQSGSSFSMVAWVNTSSCANYARAISYDDGDNDDGDTTGTRNLYLLRIVPTTCHINLAYGSSSATLENATLSSAVSTNTWTCLGGVKDYPNDKSRIYKWVPGSALAKNEETDDNTTTWTTTGQYPQIGAYYNGISTDETWPGQIAYVQLWKGKALTDQEFMDACLCPGSIVDNLQLYAPLIEDSASDLKDYSVNNLTLTNDNASAVASDGPPVSFCGGNK